MPGKKKKKPRGSSFHSYNYIIFKAGAIRHQHLFLVWRGVIPGHNPNPVITVDYSWVDSTIADCMWDFLRDNVFCRFLLYWCCRAAVTALCSFNCRDCFFHGIRMVLVHFWLLSLLASGSSKCTGLCLNHSQCWFLVLLARYLASLTSALLPSCFKLYFVSHV